MTQPYPTDRAGFERDGFAVIPELLTTEEIATAAPIFEERLPPDKQPPGVPGDSRNGRKTLISDHTDPLLSNLAGQPRLLAAVERLIGSTFLLWTTSAPVITYKSPPGAERFELGYHVDWHNNPPQAGDERFVNCALHFSTVEPNGGALMVRPGSHRFVVDNLDNPELRQRMLDQDFTDLPGLPDPVAACVPAGSGVFFHTFLVHDRSENLLDVPRKVLFCHYKGFETQQRRDEAASGAAERFAPHHVEAMDERLRGLCGLQ
jgi:ectoine hydroxylase-related dioxygenase (phytanoyl-CoA dioxygenase family)